MTEELLQNIDVERRTTRGRSCPRCSGKIIPSNRAVYTATDPQEAFPIWQCERCGYEEMGASKKPPATKATKHATGGSTAVAVTKPKTEAPMLDAKGRALPADVRALMKRFENETSDSV